MEKERFTVFENGTATNGKIFRIPEKGGSFLDLLEEIRRRFSQQRITSLYTAEGAEIVDVDLIRNDEILYAIESGEEFKPVPASGVVNSATFEQKSDFVQLNVGGTLFVTSRTSLISGHPDSMLTKMFDSDANFQPGSMDSNGAYLIDRDPKYFGSILNFLRTGKLILDNGVNPEGVAEEANFFGIQPLMEQCNLQIEQKEQAKAIELANQQLLSDNEKNKIKLEKVKLLIENRRAKFQEAYWFLKLRKEGSIRSVEHDNNLYGGKLDWDDFLEESEKKLNKVLVEIN